MRNQQVDIVHLTFKPPFATGSYNRLVGVQLERLDEFRQVAISYWEDPIRENSKNVILINQSSVPLWYKGYLLLPECIRRQRFNGIGGRESLIYLWGIERVLPRLRPRLIVFYDGYKMGYLLREKVTWPCRFILSQHGFSYLLSAQENSRLYTLHSFDVVWVLSQASYQFDRLRSMRYEPEVVVIPNGVDVERFKPPTEEEKRSLREKWKLPEDQLVVLLLSRLVPKKGFHIVLEAWSKILQKMSKCFLWIVGGGEPNYRRYLEDMVRALKIMDTVRFQGSVDPNDVPLCYRAADIYVFPSLCPESFSLTLFEAMATGLPCVTSLIPSVSEFVSEEEVMFIRNPNIVEEFIEPVTSLLTDQALRIALGKKARTAVEQRFNIELWLERLRGFYRRQLQLVGE